MIKYSIEPSFYILKHFSVYIYSWRLERNSMSSHRNRLICIFHSIWLICNASHISHVLLHIKYAPADKIAWKRANEQSNFNDFLVSLLLFFSKVLLFFEKLLMLFGVCVCVCACVCGGCYWCRGIDDMMVIWCAVHIIPFPHISTNRFGALLFFSSPPTNSHKHAISSADHDNGIRMHFISVSVCVRVRNENWKYIVILWEVV